MEVKQSKHAIRIYVQVISRFTTQLGLELLLLSKVVVMWLPLDFMAFCATIAERITAVVK